MFSEKTSNNIASVVNSRLAVYNDVLQIINRNDFFATSDTFKVEHLNIYISGMLLFSTIKEHRYEAQRYMLWLSRWKLSQIFFFRHFSHVTKSRIFKNLNLRKKAHRNFRGTFLKNHFRHLKLYSNPPSWLARNRCHMGNFWKTKDWSSHFRESQAFRYWYVEVHRQRRLKSTKTGISS